MACQQVAPKDIIWLIVPIINNKLIKNVFCMNQESKGLMHSFLIKVAFEALFNSSFHHPLGGSFTSEFILMVYSDEVILIIFIQDVWNYNLSICLLEN